MDVSGAVCVGLSTRSGGDTGFIGSLMWVKLGDIHCNTIRGLKFVLGFLYRLPVLGGVGNRCGGGPSPVPSGLLAFVSSR